MAGGDQRPQSKPDRPRNTDFSDLLAERDSDDNWSRAIVHALLIRPTQRAAGNATFSMSTGLLPDRYMKRLFKWFRSHPWYEQIIMAIPALVIAWFIFTLVVFSILYAIEGYKAHQQHQHY